MNGFQVAPDELDRLIRTLEDSANQVRAANAELGGFSSTEEMSSGVAMAINTDAAAERLETLGNEELGGAAVAFAKKWRYGLDKLDEAAGEVIGRLREIRLSYVDLDHGAAETFSRISSQSTILDTLAGAP